MYKERNVIDYYEYWSTEAIVADLRTKHHNFSVLVVNKINDFNLGSVIRNANAFCAKEVIVYGKKKYDKRGTVGAHLYTNINHVKFIEEINVCNSILVGIDNIPSSIPIETFEWPKEHVIMAFGQEVGGLSEEITKMCKHLVYINQYGSVRSLNVGVASGIAMYDYCQKMSKNH